MRNLFILMILSFILAAYGFGARSDFDPHKPGYVIGKAIEDITRDQTTLYLEDINLSERTEKTEHEKELRTLAEDFLGCAYDKKTKPEQCILGGDLSRYGYYQSLALSLNAALVRKFDCVGKVLRMAVNELQGTVTHKIYEESLRCPDGK